MTEAAHARSRVGRYQLGDELAAGGMATVHLARVLGPAGISRVVAVKRMHAHVANDPAARRMFLDEARLAYRISHPNVVATLDVVEHDAEVLIVLEYVAGETLARILQAMAATGERMDVATLSAIVVGALHGLHAAHEALDEHGHPVHVVHRDVSPQNLIVGVDGVTRVLDFGIAKAQGRLQETTGIAVRGKLRYLSPEQIRRTPVDRRVDLFATGVVLWEALVGRRLFDADDIAGVLDAVLHAEIVAPHRLIPSVPEALSQLVLRALSRDPQARPGTALAFADELSTIVPPVAASEVAATVKRWATDELARREALVARLVAGDVAGPQRARAASRRDLADPDGTEPEMSGEPVATGETVAVTPVAKGSRRSARWILTIGALSLLSAAAMLAFSRKDVPSGSSEPPRAAAAVPGLPQAVTQEPFTKTAAPAETAASAEKANARKEAVPVASQRKGLRRPAAASSSVASRPRAPNDNGCEFPFVIGEGGVRIPKKACFGP